jgi:hypothetical protein
MGMNQPPIANYKNHLFPPEIVARTVWLFRTDPSTPLKAHINLRFSSINNGQSRVKKWVN